MNILIDIGHPAHVHLFKGCARELEKRGHKIKFTARDKESSIKLLKTYNFDFEPRGELKRGLIGKALSMLSTDYKVFKVARKFKADLFVGVHNPYTAQVAKISGKKSITFTDTEGVHIASKLTFPFTDTIITPKCFREKINPKKHIIMEGYKELAYLHPNRFTPNREVLESIGITNEDRYIIVRLISWAASHDVGLSGIRPGSEEDFIKELERFGKVFITSERELKPELEKYRLNCPPDKIHSLLYYADMYIGEGGTMTTEAAILGTPAIHIESNSEGVATGNFCGVFRELRDVYDLAYFYPTQEEAIKKAISILSNPKTKEEWRRKRSKLLEEKVDVTKWLTDFIDNYPESIAGR